MQVNPSETLELEGPLVTVEWLSAHLSHPGVAIVDASWHLPNANRDAHQDFLKAHIPGATFFDLETNSSHATNLPHMLPSREAFGTAVGEMGINNQTAVVVYDTEGLFSAARLWWMFRVFGHRNVAVLDGGLVKWKKSGFVTEPGAPILSPTPEEFNVTFDSSLIYSREVVYATSLSKDAVIIDARSPARFAGEEPEPREGMRAGHIPGSKNVHYASLFNADHTLKSKDELRELLAIGMDRPVISSCGSGVTACILDLCFALLGHENHAVYDGSWAEWGQDTDLPVETGRDSN